MPTLEELAKKAGVQPLASTTPQMPKTSIEELAKKANVSPIISQKPSENISFEPAKKSIIPRIAEILSPKSVEGFGATLGGALATQSKDVKAASESQRLLDESNDKLSKLIIKNKKEGKDTTRLQNQLRQSLGYNFDISQIIPETQKTTKQIAGEGLGVLGTAALGAKPSTSVLGRLGFGTVLGAGTGVQKALQKEENFGEIVKEGFKGAGVGLALSGIFEGIGAGLRKVASSKMGERVAGRVYTRELAPPKKEIAKDIENGFKTFGEEVSQVVDDAGKPIYVGRYRTLLSKAKSELADKGEKLMQRADNYSDTFITRNEAAGDIVQQMQNEYGRLTPKQLKDISFEVSRMPQQFNIKGGIETKRLYDNLIPDSFWTKIDDPATSFASSVKYKLRDKIRQLINEKTADPVIQKLNNEMSIAMDVKKLTASQLAQRELKSGATGLWSRISKIADDTIFNPAITTRASQTLRNLGQSGKSNILRNITVLGTNKKLNQ
jgi:hypothetical protein